MNVVAGQKNEIGIGFVDARDDASEKFERHERAVMCVGEVGDAETEKGRRQVANRDRVFADAKRLRFDKRRVSRTRQRDGTAGGFEKCSS
jgi:hypothetical protein